MDTSHQTPALPIMSTTPLYNIRNTAFVLHFRIGWIDCVLQKTIDINTETIPSLVYWQTIEDNMRRNIVYQVSSSLLELKLMFSRSIVLTEVVEVTTLLCGFCATISSCVEPALLNRACSNLVTAMHALNTWGQHAALWEPKANP